MQVTVGRSLLIIFLIAITIFSTRVIPFIVFPKGKEIPEMVQYLGRVLPYAVMGLLIVYCFKSTSVVTYPHAIPEAISVAVVVLTYVWKRNNLISIGLGTVLYMFLIQVVFV